MISTQNHIIEKVSFEINSKNTESASLINNNISSWFQNDFVTQLELLFDKYNPKNSIIRFKKVRLDFTLENVTDFGAIQREIIYQLEEKIKEHISLSEISQKNEGSLEEGDTEIQKVSNAQNAGDVFLYFLEKGYLPWYANQSSLDEISVPESFQKQLKNNLFSEKLKAVFNNDERAVRRFVMQMPNEVVFIYLENLDSDFGEIKIQFKRWSKKLGPKLRKAFLQFYINHTAGADTKTIVQKLEKLFTEFVWSQGWNSENEKGIQKEKSQLLKIFGKLLPAKTVSDKRYSKFAKPILNRLDRKNSSKLELQQKEIINAETNFLEKEKDEIAVQNAGLILLHPFLKTFFIRTEIADEFGNINPQKLDLAIQSLHFLATGKENVFESNLVFEKFLCGVPLKIPVARQSLITDEIKDLAEDLLKAVIGHWQAIGNTSPDGLRESFLQRNGKLIRNENNYKLIVERKVYDVLLDKLTWNISMVKLNWIKELITVEW